MEWIKTSDKMPDYGQLVLAYNIKNKDVKLACLFFDNNKWFWVVSNGILYVENNVDDYVFTHWMPLPELPKFE